MGTTGHMLISLVAETVIEKLGITVRTIPNATYVGRAYMARLGDTMTSIEMAPGMMFLQEGLFEYASYDWGPQPVRYLNLPQHNGHALAVRGDSDIYEGKNLKGKKIARVPGSAAFDQTTVAMLAFFGLSEDDIVNVEFPSPVAGWNAEMEGKVDSLFWNTVAPKSYEMESKCGLRWLPMPADDKEGWANAQKILAIQPKSITVGVNMDEQNPLAGSTSAYPCIVSWDHLDPDIAYWITKSVWETRDAYQPKHDVLKIDWTEKAHWTLWEGEACPLHEGSIQYFKDIGQWNDARQKMQDERLQRQADLKKLYDKVKAEGLALGLKAKEFPAFWLEKRAAGGF